MDAEREAREIVKRLAIWLSHPNREALRQAIEDLARRAHAAGRREAVEECAKVAENSGAYSGTVIAHEIRALAAGAGEQKEGEG